MMYCNYEDYLSNQNILTMEEMHELHQEVLTEIQGDEEAGELYEELLAVGNKYAAIRSGWLLLDREERLETDPGRTSCHDSLITHFNMLARYLRQQGKPAEWREKLGYEEDDKYNRKKLGDFACYVAFVNAINSR